MVKKKTNDIEEKVNKKEEQINIEALKEELNKYIDDKIKKEFTAELERANKRLLREKNIKIITKNMIITILLLIIVYLVYILNDNNYFDKLFINNNNKINIKTNNKENEEEKEVTLDELKKEYSYLLDNIYISDTSDYLTEYYSGELTTELKHYLTLNTLTSDDIIIEDDYNIIDEKTFKNKYQDLFTSDYISKSFKYNDNFIRYISKLDSYISSSLITKTESNIKRTIIDINISNNKITITTIEGLIKDNILYNIISNEEIAEYNDNLTEYSDNLNKIEYVFDTNDRLISINSL